jgi:potassium/chloride transporter 4/5/6
MLGDCGCSGADRATNLRRPEKSIPAIVVSFVMYTSYMGLWAAVAQRDYLLGNVGSGEHAMLDVVREVAFPVAILTELGISMAAIAQAMQCIIISPRLLQVENFPNLRVERYVENFDMDLNLTCVCMC